MQILFLVFLFALGACIGSFLCCQARRLRLRELGAQTSVHKPRGKHQTKKPPLRPRTTGRHHHAQSHQTNQTQPRLTHQSHQSHQPLGNRSVCFNCGKTISWYDNIPLFSWLLLRGKCRHCHQKIGLLEPVSELSCALAYLLFGLTLSPLSPLPHLGLPPQFTASPLDPPLLWLFFLLSLLLASLLAFLAIYDAAYSELPTLPLTFSIICAIIIASLKTWASFRMHGWSPSLFIEPLGSIFLLAGVYLFLYLFSHGRWVGDGDWLLGLSLGAALMSPWLALITLCLANLLACLLTLPKYQKNLRIPLGPFLVTAFIIVYPLANFFTNLL